jgi:hypothetical protein
MGTTTNEKLAQLPMPFKAIDAEQLGITSWQLRQMVSGAQVRQVLREVYVRSDLPDTIELRASALALVAPPHAVICDRTAAWLWGVDTLRPWELEILPRLEAFVLSGRTRIRRPQAGGGERDLCADDIVMIGGVRVTSPVRTSLDLGCCLSRSEALAAMNGFARIHGVGVAELATLLPRYRGRRGVVQARELVPLVDPRSESTGESFTRLAIHDEGLPVPTPQFWVRIGGVPTYRLDLAYPRLKVCVEYDGEEFHSSDEAEEADRIRREWLRDNGWVVIVVTKADFRGRAREAWLRELRFALADRMR